MAYIEVYQADAEDYYSGVTYADENPLREGDYLIPAGAYTDAPDLAALQPNQAYKRSEDKTSWVVVPDFRGVQFWLSDGTKQVMTTRGVGLPEGASLTQVERPLTPQEERKVFEAYIQDHINATAQSWGYDSAMSAISYIGDPHPRFDADGVAIRAFRSACWVSANAIYAQVIAGDIPKPTKDELMAMLPAVPTQPVLSNT